MSPGTKRPRQAAGSVLSPESPFVLDENRSVIRLAKMDAAAASQRAKKVIDEATAHPSPTVRRGAYAAAARLLSLSGEGLLPLVVGLRDPDPVAAWAAFTAFARRPEWLLNRPLTKQFLLARRLAQQSPDAGLRRNAAGALKAKRVSITRDELAVEADQLLAAFGGDIDAEVRHAARDADSHV